MKMTDAMKQVLTFALIALVLVVIIPMVKRSLKPIPGVQARVREIFTITLDSSADPAFRWDLLATDRAKVQLLNQPDAEDAVARTEVWTFRALAPGRVTLYFGYIRIGYPNSVAIRTHAVLLTVNP
jgi:predicted secreted protein